MFQSGKIPYQLSVQTCQKDVINPARIKKIICYVLMATIVLMPQLKFNAQLDLTHQIQDIAVIMFLVYRSLLDAIKISLVKLNIWDAHLAIIARSQIKILLSVRQEHIPLTQIIVLIILNVLMFQKDAIKIKPAKQII